MFKATDLNFNNGIGSFKLSSQFFLIFILASCFLNHNYFAFASVSKNIDDKIFETKVNVSEEDKNLESTKLLGDLLSGFDFKIIDSKSKSLIRDPNYIYSYSIKLHIVDQTEKSIFIALYKSDEFKSLSANQDLQKEHYISDKVVFSKLEPHMNLIEKSKFAKILVMLRAEPNTLNSYSVLRPESSETPLSEENYQIFFRSNLN